MKKFFFSIIIVLLLSFSTTAQDYNWGIGIRGGLSNGLTVKHFIGENAAIEGILATRWSGFCITGLYELHKNIITERMNFYYGLGGHIASWDGSKNDWFNDNDQHTVIGIDGIIGLEYNFEQVPINISIDYKPGFNLVGYSGYWGDEAALSIRFIF